jgi:hypothetical protein
LSSIFQLEVFAGPAFLGIVMATFCVCSSVPPTPPTHSAAFKSEPFFSGLKTVSFLLSLVNHYYNLISQSAIL